MVKIRCGADSTRAVDSGRHARCVSPWRRCGGLRPVAYLRSLADESAGSALGEGPNGLPRPDGMKNS